MNGTVAEMRKLVAAISRRPEEVSERQGQPLLRSSCQSRTGNRQRHVLLAFIAGAAVGAAVALLFAPATGEETRGYLSRRGT